MKRLLTLLLFSLPLAAQPVMTGLYAELADGGSVRLEWVSSVTSGDTARCYSDDDADVSDATERTPQVASTSANSGRRNCVIYTAADSGALYVGPQSCVGASCSALNICTGTCTNCGSGDNSVFRDSSGLNCGGSGQAPSITVTVANSSAGPDAPTTTALEVPPAVTGGTYAAASGCGDISTQHGSAETDAEDGGDAVALTMVAGEECPVSSFQLRNVSSGTIIVRTTADSKTLPPPGALTSKVYKPQQAKLTYSSMAAMGDPLITHATSAKNYYFENVEIGYPDLDSSVLTPCDMAITGINTSTDTITVDDASCLAATASGQMVVVDLSGTGVRGGYGPMQVGTVTANSFKLYTGCTQKGFCGGTEGTLVNLVGTYGSGGTVRRWIVLPIEAIADCGDGEACLTITGHGIPNFPDMTITGGTSNTVTVSGTPSEYQIGSSSAGTATARVVHIEGSSGGNCDGLWNASVSGSTLTLSRTGATPDCAGVSSGTVHGHRAVSLYMTSADSLGDFEPRAWNVEAEDADTLRVLESTYEAASGGYVVWDVEPMGSLIDLNDQTSSRVANVTFDRIVSDTCFPWNSRSWMASGTTDNVAVINSFQRSCSWQRVNPVSGAIERIHGYSQAHATMDLRRAHGTVIRNNYMGPMTFLFADDAGDGSYSTQCFQDAVIRENYFWNPGWVLERNTEEYRNHYFHGSFTPAELKSACGPIEIVGNYMKRPGKSNFQQTQAAITLSLNGSNTAQANGPHDVRIDSNFADQGGGSFVALTQTTLDANKMFLPTERISIQGNLITRTDTIRYGGSASNAAGYLLTTSTGFRNAVISNNTYMPERCVVCRWLDFNARHVTGLTVEDNILMGTMGSNENRGGIFTLTSGSDLPAFTNAGGYPAFQDAVRRDGATDAGVGSSFNGNIGIPGVKASNTGTWAVKAASLDPADAYCPASADALDKFSGLTSGGFLDWIGDAGSCASSLAESVIDRMNTAFEAAVWTPKSAYTGKGASPATIEAEMGMCGPVTVSSIDDTEAQLSFTTPSNEEVYVTYVAWDTDLATTLAAMSGGTRGQTANGATTSKTFTMSSLTAETKYLYKIHGGVSGGGCRKEIIGELTTAGSAGGGGPAIPTEGLVAHYAITGGSGQTAADSSGNSNDCQLGSTAGSDANDPAWTTDGSETVLSFTGENKGLLCPTDTTGPFSMFIALKVDSANRSGQDTWFYGHGGPDQGPFGTNVLKMYTEGIGVFSGTNVNITSYYDEWHVYWATFDGTAIHLGVDKTEWESTTWAAIDNTNISIGNSYIFNDGVTGLVGYALIYDSDYTSNIDAVIDGINAAKPGLGILP